MERSTPAARETRELRDRLLAEGRRRQNRASSENLSPAERMRQLFELVAWARRVHSPEATASRPTDESAADLLALRARLCAHGGADER